MILITPTVTAPGDITAVTARESRHLDDARAIAEVDEHEAAEVAAPVHPSAKTHTRPDIVEAQRATERIAKSSLERRAWTHEANSRRRGAV